MALPVVAIGNTAHKFRHPRTVELPPARINTARWARDARQTEGRAANLWAAGGCCPATGHPLGAAKGCGVKFDGAEPGPERRLQAKAGPPGSGDACQKAESEVPEIIRTIIIRIP